MAGKVSSRAKFRVRKRRSSDRSLNFLKLFGREIILRHDFSWDFGNNSFSLFFSSTSIFAPQFLRNISLFRRIRATNSISRNAREKQKQRRFKVRNEFIRAEGIIRSIEFRGFASQLSENLPTAERQYLLIIYPLRQVSPPCQRDREKKYFIY